MINAAAISSFNGLQIFARVAARAAAFAAAPAEKLIAAKLFFLVSFVSYAIHFLISKDVVAPNRTRVLVHAGHCPLSTQDSVFVLRRRQRPVRI